MRFWYRVLNFLGIRKNIFIPYQYEVDIKKNSFIEEVKYVLIVQNTNHQFRLEIPNTD